MGILYDMKVMLLYYGADLLLNVKSQNGKQLIIEWHRNAHVFDGYLYVVNDRLHEFLSIVAQSRPNETELSYSECIREQAASPG